MTFLPAAALAASVASAHSPATEAAPDPAALSATAVLAGPLPHEVRMKGDGWWLDGHPLTGSDEAQTAAVLTILEHAPGNEERVARARRRELQALGLALGGLGFESAGLVVAVAAASGVVGVAAGPALALPIGLTGAGIGLTGCAIGISNPPLRRAVRQYNAWAAQHPDALEQPVSAGTVEAAQAWPAPDESP